MRGWAREVAAIDFNAESGFDGRGYDMMIVGAGAAGLYLASLLAKKMRVLVFESGHWAMDGERQILNEIEQTGKRMQNAVETRRRVSWVTGGLLLWGGRTVISGLSGTCGRPAARPEGFLVRGSVVLLVFSRPQEACWLCLRRVQCQVQDCRAQRLAVSVERQ